MKATRNKTIDISLSHGRQYLQNCLKIKHKVACEDILNKTILGDAFRVLPLLPDKFVDLMIVDPPYNMAKNFHGNKFKRISDDDYAEYTREWIEATRHVLKDNASLYVCCDWQSSMIIAEVLKQYFCIQNRITWQRDKGRGARHNWKNSMEDIWFASVSDDYVFNIDDVKMRRRVLAPYKHQGQPKDWENTAKGKFRNTFPSNFWDDITIPYWSMPENTLHPTQKPEKLLAKLILASSERGGVVFDPFLGSGSTSVTAKKLYRNYVGIEQNKQYCIWAERRLEIADFDTSIQGYTDGVFWEKNTYIFQKNK